MELSQAAWLARTALEEEVCLWPKPGLVTPRDPGAHDDMDWFSFMASAEALEPYFLAVLQLGASSSAMALEELWSRLRPLGLWGEELMKGAAGANTHKGALFSLGVLCCALGRLWARKEPLIPDKVALEGASICRGIVSRELAPLKAQRPRRITAGQRFYLLYGFKGIRGEAERGFPSVLAALGFWRSLEGRLSRREQLVQTLLFLMTFVEDTNVLSRCGLEGLRELQGRSRQVLALGGLTTQEGRLALAAMERPFLERRMSPGGCADLLALAIFLDSLTWQELPALEPPEKTQ